MKLNWEIFAIIHVLCINDVAIKEVLLFLIKLNNLRQKTDIFENGAEIWPKVRVIESPVTSTTCWILTKLGRNDPYMAGFNNCSNVSICCISRSHRLKKDFHD